MTNSIKRKFAVVALHSGDNTVVDTEREVTEYLLAHPNDIYMVNPTYVSVPRETMSYRVSIIMPVFERPQRTVRAINSVLNQDTSNWQLLCLGDGCSKFQELIDGNWFKEIQAKAYLNGNEIVGINTEHSGGYGYRQRELGKQMATGKWTLYLDNDDVLLPTHLSTRLKVAEASPSLDLLYFDTEIEPKHLYRDAQLEFGKIGHSEVMFRTEFLKTISPMPDHYGHDWQQISEALGKGAKTMKGGGVRTYIIKSTPDAPEKTNLD